MITKKPEHRVRCPNCDSNELSTRVTDRDLSYMTEEVTCDTCGYSWIERYTLILEEIEE